MDALLSREVRSESRAGGNRWWMQSFASRHNHASTSSLNFFTDRMLFLTPNQQCQSTEGPTCWSTISTLTHLAFNVINDSTTLSRQQETIGREILMNRSDRFTSRLRLRKTAKRGSAFRATQPTIVCTDSTFKYNAYSRHFYNNN